MTIKTLFAVLALSLTPALASAQCLGSKAKITASACGESMVYDSATKSCVLKPTS